MDTQPPRPHMTRAQTSQYIEKVHGVPCSTSSLSKMAVRGDGAPYTVVGRDALYDPADVDTWVRTLFEKAIKGASTSARAIPGRVKPKGRPPNTRPASIPQRP
jgi:hypothetical protein